MDAQPIPGERWRYWLEDSGRRVFQDPDKGAFTFGVWDHEKVYQEALVRAERLMARGLGSLRVRRAPD